MKPDIRSVAIEVASGCNLQCEYCYNGQVESSNNMTVAIADNALEFIFKSVKKNEIHKLPEIIFIGGEPLLNFILIKYIVEKYKTYAKKHNLPDPSFNITTNGTLLTDEIIEYAEQNNFNCTISLDGNREVHNSSRMSKNGKDYYSEIMKSLKKINKLKNFHCAARATVTKKSIPDFYQKVIKPFDEFGIKHYIFALANALNNDISLSTEEAIENAKEQVYFCFKDIIHGGRIKNITVLQYMGYLLSNSVKERSCGVGKSYIAICYDGSIVPCHRAVNNKNISIGNIWDGLDEDKIQLYENATVTHRKECQKCPVRYFCKAHCCHYSLTSLGGINRVDSLSCAFHKTFIYETYKLFFNLKESNPNAYNKVLKQVFDNIYASDKKNDLIFIKKINPLDSIEKTVRRNCTFGKNSLVEVIDFDRGGILFIDNEPIKKYFANTGIMAIWDTINGALTAQEIAQKIACGCGGELTEIEEDIYQQLAFLREIGFIEEIKIYKQLDQQIVTIE